MTSAFLNAKPEKKASRADPDPQIPWTMGRNRYAHRGVTLISKDVYVEKEVDNRLMGTGSMPQKGIVYYGVAPNRQKPLAGALNSAIFNTFRRTRDQILWWAVPMLLAYAAMDWATKR